MRGYRELKVWAKAHKLTMAIYKDTKGFPREETFGLQSQMRRAASSIPSNLAEGCGRETVPGLTRFLHIAMGSASELDYQLLLAHDLNYISDADYTGLLGELSEIKRMLIAYIQRIKQNNGDRN